MLLVEELKRLGSLMVGATPAPGIHCAARYIRSGDIRESGAATASAQAPEPVRGRDAKLAAGDVILRARGTPVAAAVDARSEGAFPTNDVLLFRPDRDKLDSGYAAAFLNLPQTREALSATTQGTALPRLSVQALGSIRMPVPPLDAQRKIAALADCMCAERNILERLRELRWRLHQGILQQLLLNQQG